MRWIAALVTTLGLLTPTLQASAPSASATERLLGTARDYALQALYEAASALLQAGYAAAREQRDSCTQARLGTELGRIQGEQALFRGGPATGTRTLLEETQRAAQACGEPAVIADAADALGLDHYREALDGTPQAFAVARQLFAQALEIRSRLPDRAARGESQFHVGLVHEQTGEAEPARVRYTAALADAEASGDRRLASYAYRHLAGYQEPSRGRAGVLEYFRKSLELRRELGWLPGIVFAELALAQTHAEGGDASKAEAHYAAALEVAAGGRIHRGAAQAALALAGLTAGKDARRSHGYYATAWEHARAMGDGATAERAWAGVEAGLRTN